MDKRYNVIEVLWGPPHTIGRIRVVPVRKDNARLKLRNARYRLCNAEFKFADGVACGIMMERRSQ